MNAMEVLNALVARAKTYRGTANESIRRNGHMNGGNVAGMSQEQIDALLTDFINYFAGDAFGVDLALYTSDLNTPVKA